ncbi:transglutaminase family protein [Bacillus sp. AFS037270]|uniref:transglutaminase family protein n=1 Tax=Bacillus sp. AFS037270 TaxID=2033499 RepID=UPI000BFC3DF9|nr:transglutaminase family protein [Bacillus sp. AFS037270]PGV53298.1 transglutaminase [Bacillus sp. AFS037270]
MKLQISHLTHYTYQEPVTDSVNEIRLSPRTDDRQSCCKHSIVVEPSVPLFTYEDYFGNTAHFFTVPSPHRELLIHSYSIVETDEKNHDAKNRLPFATERDILSSEPFQNKYAEYLMETGYTRITPELKTFCRERINERNAGNVYELLEQISSTIYSYFTYDTEVTHVHTTVEETLQLKSGVCQDYAHLMIAIGRMFNIPARYVSGYQFIGDLNDGQTEVQHASHAWVEAYVPLTGWMGFDPTNNGKVNWRYVKIGHGRDYSDIVPVKGVYQGTNKQHLQVTVDVKRIEEN